MVQVQSKASMGRGSSQKQPQPQIKILVVEDSYPIMEAIAGTLESLGYHVVRASDGMEALDRFEFEDPDLVILDLKLPLVSGFRLLRIFKGGTLGKKVPVIVVTAMDFEEAVEVAEAGADDFLNKPFNSDQLARKVGFILGQGSRPARQLA